MVEGSNLSITCSHAREDQVLPAIERRILINGTVVASGPDTQVLTYSPGPANVSLDGSEVTCQLTNTMGTSDVSETLRIVGGHSYLKVQLKTFLHMLT